MRLVEVIVRWMVLVYGFTRRSLLLSVIRIIKCNYIL